MSVAVNDKLTGNMMLVFVDGTFFHADCVLTVTGTGTNYGATGTAAEAVGATGATGATGAAHAAAGHQGAAGHHEAKK